MTDNLAIVPASLAVWPLIVDLFAAGGDPRWCWCQYWRKPGSNWTNTTADGNRLDLEARIPPPGSADEAVAPGLVALRDGVAVGWVGLGPREGFPRLERSRTLPMLPGEAIWSINCFVVAKAARRGGIATALLDAALAYARAHGAGVVEGYPVRGDGTRLAPGVVYTGTASMFERAGFTVAAESTSKSVDRPRRVVMRRTP